MATANPRRGYLLAITAFTAWGLFPLYFKLVAHIPPTEIIVHRVIWSAVFAAALLLVWRHPGALRELRDHPRRLAVLGASGLLIASNWLLYVWAINNGRVMEASLGYYINPLVNVLLGMIVLHERLRPMQWIAVGFAVLGVAQQVFLLGSLPWVSLVLAMSFGLYGLIRRQAPVQALPGMAVETWLLLPIGLGWLWLHPGAVSAQAVFWDSPGAWLLVLAGPLTVMPLMSFNAAARHIPYATLGFLQYIAPTMILLLAIFVFGEPLDRSRLLAFACIWTGLAIYSVDAWRALRRSAANG